MWGPNILIHNQSRPKYAILIVQNTTKINAIQPTTAVELVAKIFHIIIGAEPGFESTLGATWIPSSD